MGKLLFIFSYKSKSTVYEGPGKAGSGLDIGKPVTESFCRGWGTQGKQEGKSLLHRKDT